MSFPCVQAAPNLFPRHGLGRCRRDGGPCRMVGEASREVPVASRNFAATCGRGRRTSRHGGGTCWRVPGASRQGWSRVSKGWSRAKRGKNATFSYFRPFCRKRGRNGQYWRDRSPRAAEARFRKRQEHRASALRCMQIEARHLHGVAHEDLSVGEGGVVPAFPFDRLEARRFLKPLRVCAHQHQFAFARQYD